VYTVVISNYNWTMSAVYTYTPGGSPPNASVAWGGNAAVTFNAPSVTAGFATALNMLLGLPGWTQPPMSK
jgi:hypothetical protein